MINEKDVANELKAYAKIAIFCHVRPDGDTVGSALALKMALESAGKTADVYCQDDIPEKFSFLKDCAQIKNSLEDEYSLYVAVDVSDAARMGVFSAAFCAQQRTLCVDHHISNTRFAKMNCVLNAPSTAEIIHEVIRELGVTPDKLCAEALYVGIVTDTGNFTHSDVTENTFKTAGELVKCGADVPKIDFLVFKKQSRARARLFGLTMSRIRYFSDDRIALISVRERDFAETCAKPEVTEGFIDFIMGIENVEVGACLMESAPDAYKISLRAKQTDVNAVAQTFGGGGHKLASGCMLRGDFEEVVDRLIYAVKQHLRD